jgi:outer membrane lipoprotein-sorting protein
MGDLHRDQGLKGKRPGNARSRCLAALVACLASPLAGQETPPAAEDLLRQMSAKLASLQSFHFSAVLGFDDVPLPDVKVKYRGSMEVSMQRPGRLRVSYQDELTAREVWIDGETVTVLVPEEAHWASAPAESSLDATLKRFAADYGVSMDASVVVGTSVTSLPMGGETVFLKSQRYYYFGGTFYESTDSGYRVVAAPIGVSVRTPPGGAELVTVNGKQYLQTPDAYYLALYSGHGLVYRVVEDPHASS